MTLSVHSPDEPSSCSISIASSFVPCMIPIGWEGCKRKYKQNIQFCQGFIGKRLLYCVYWSLVVIIFIKHNWKPNWYSRKRGWINWFHNILSGESVRFQYKGRLIEMQLLCSLMSYDISTKDPTLFLNNFCWTWMLFDLSKNRILKIPNCMKTELFLDVSAAEKMSNKLCG